MRYGQDSGYGFDPMSRMRGATVVKVLLLTNVALYILELVAQATGYYGLMIGLLGMVPKLITDNHFFWQFLTACFLHAGFFHILFNMLALFFFGPELEWLWGKVRFLFVYLAIGILANVFAYLLNIHATTPTLGASGALFGLLGAYAAIYPNRMIIFMIFPVKVKYFVLFYFIFSLLATTGLEIGGGQGVAYAVHLAGIVLGFLYVKMRWGRLSLFFKNNASRIRLWYLKRKYRHLKIADEILVDDEQHDRWNRYKQ